MNYIKSIKQFSEYSFPQTKDKPETKCSGFIIYYLVLIFGEYTENFILCNNSASYQFILHIP